MGRSSTSTRSSFHPDLRRRLCRLQVPRGKRFLDAGHLIVNQGSVIVKVVEAGKFTEISGFHAPYGVPFAKVSFSDTFRAPVLQP